MPLIRFCPRWRIPWDRDIFICSAVWSFSRDRLLISSNLPLPKISPMSRCASKNHLDLAIVWNFSYFSLSRFLFLFPPFFFFFLIMLGNLKWQEIKKREREREYAFCLLDRSEDAFHGDIADGVKSLETRLKYCSISLKTAASTRRRIMTLFPAVNSR